MYVSRNFLLFVSNNSLWRFSVDANLIQREIDKAVNSIEYKHEPQLTLIGNSSFKRKQSLEDPQPLATKNYG